MATEHLMKPSSLDPEALALRGEVYWGVVSTMIDDDVVVAHDGRSSFARRAASCLLAPRAGDRVLLARVEARVFVLAVLERDEPDREIDVEGDLRLRSRRGSVSVEADEVRLRASSAVSIAGKTLTLAAQHASWAAEQAQIVAERIVVDAKRLRQVADFTEIVAESVKESLGRSYRNIRESEHVSAGTLTLSLRGVLRAHAETAIVTAKKLVKFNADQIHLG